MGFWSHLRLSRNPRCQAAHDDLLDSMDASGAPPRDHVTRFSGDAFGTAGDYEGDDFGQEPDSESQSEDGDSGPEDEQRLFDQDLEDSWEPERPSTLIHEPTHTPPTQVHDLNADLHDTHLRLLAEERAHNHPQIVRYSETYPASRVGTRLGNTGTTADANYARSINGGNNTWAPFKSEIDWKVARWAKLRGPGSTAFSELLAIDGVRYLFVHRDCSLIFW